MYLGLGAKKKTYIDDVFSTNAYVGAGSGQVINNGIDNSSEGGMVWFKRRDGTYDHQIVDTVRGGSKGVQSNTTSGTVNTQYISAFNTNGYTLGTESAASGSGDKFAAWNFRKAPGFFDVVSWTGNSSNRTIAHSLECVPGMILIKELTNSSKWIVHHRSIGAANILSLNEDSIVTSGATNFNSTDPTSTHFSLGGSSHVNGSGETYIAYLFAGGESTAATATSVDFDGTNDKLTLSATSGDLAFGTGDYTWECWIKFDAISTTWKTIFQSSTALDNNTFFLSIDSNSVNVGHQNAFIIQAAHTFHRGQWYHIAACRASGTLRMFVNGTEVGSVSDGTNWSSSTGDAWIGANSYNGWADGHDGKISNMRIVKGTALYTSSFRAPTEPLQNVTNTKLLCLQGSSATSATVIPSGSITNDGATHSSDSPFDDSAGFVFGGKEGVVKCGVYTGNTSADGPEVHLGWEPQWIMFKNLDTAEHWLIRDSMRGIGAGTLVDPSLAASTNSSESAGNRIELTANGFKLTSSHGDSNKSGDKYIYIAIRRPDGYVGKPADAGTGVFAMDTGSNSSTIPNFDSTFSVDFALMRNTGSTEHWYTGERKTIGKYMSTDRNVGENGSTESNWVFDSNVGWAKSYTSSYQSWMWKRGAGFDAVNFHGNSTSGHTIPHSLNAVPEMMWVKNRGKTESWYVFHKDNGSNPENKALNLNTNGVSQTGTWIWNDTLPTSTHFTLGNDNSTNGDGYEMQALLFASVNGISKVGSYTGSGDTQTITTGFQPRFVIIKNIDASGNGWYVLDTVRGWGSGDDKYLFLDTDAAQGDHNFGAPTSTGFTVDNNFTGYNSNGTKYIYYAHA